MGVAYCKVPVRARWERMLRKKTVPSVKGLLALVSLARQVCVSATARATYVRQKGARKRGESSRPDFTKHCGLIFVTVLASFWWAKSLGKSRGQMSPLTVASFSLLLGFFLVGGIVGEISRPDFTKHCGLMFVTVLPPFWRASFLVPFTCNRRPAKWHAKGRKNTPKRGQTEAKGYQNRAKWEPTAAKMGPEASQGEPAGVQRRKGCQN